MENVFKTSSENNRIKNEFYSGEEPLFTNFLQNTHKN